MTVEAVPCSQHGCVDLRDVRYPNDGVLHLTAAEWTEFLAAAKRGVFDEMSIEPKGSRRIRGLTETFG